MLSINDTPHIRQTFARFEVVEVATTYTVGRESTKQVQELIFSNFTPSKGLLDYC